MSVTGSGCVIRVLIRTKRDAHYARTWHPFLPVPKEPPFSRTSGLTKIVLDNRPATVVSDVSAA